MCNEFQFDSEEQGQELTEKLLLSNIKASIKALETLLQKVNSEGNYENGVYRYYHTSFKVYNLQILTTEIVNTLQQLLPGRELNKMFRKIISEGSGKNFAIEVNNNWEAETRPIIEAFLHAKYMLEMAVKYGKQLAEPPECLHYGWASLLYLFEMR